MFLFQHAQEVAHMFTVIYFGYEHVDFLREFPSVAILVGQTIIY